MRRGEGDAELEDEEDNLWVFRCELSFRNYITNNGRWDDGGIAGPLYWALFNSSDWRDRRVNPVTREWEVLLRVSDLNNLQLLFKPQRRRFRRARLIVGA